MLDMFKSKSRNFPDLSVVDHINVCKFSHLCGAELYLNLAILRILRRSFQWCWHGFSLTGPCQKLKKPWKGLLAGKWKGVSQIQKYIPCSKLRAMVKGRSTERATIKKASRGMQHAKMHHAIKHNAEDFRKYWARNWTLHPCQLGTPHRERFKMAGNWSQKLCPHYWASREV